MRRTSIGDLLDAGADLSAAQQLAGRSTTAATFPHVTTASYTERPGAANRRLPSLLALWNSPVQWGVTTLRIVPVECSIALRSAHASCPKLLLALVRTPA